MVTRHVFDSNLQAKVDKDHNQPLNIYTGSDNFLQIGEPEVILLIMLYLCVGCWNERQSKF